MSSYSILIQPLITIITIIVIIIITTITTMQYTWTLKTENTKMMRMDKISKSQLVEKNCNLSSEKKMASLVSPNV